MGRASRSIGPKIAVALGTVVTGGLLGYLVARNLRRKQAQEDTPPGSLGLPFNGETLESYLSIVEKIVEDYAKRWEQAREFAWVSEYKKVSASICAALLLGVEPEADNNELVPVLDTLLAGLTAIPLRLPWTAYGRALESRDRLLALIDQAILNHRQQSYDDMLAHLLNSTGEGRRPLTEQQVRTQTIHMFCVSYGGIFRVLSLMCMELALYPEATERARQEALRAATLGPLTLDRLGRLTFLEQVTREVRRHNGIFASTFIPQKGGSMQGHRCPDEDLTTLIMKLVGAILLRSYMWELPPQDLALNNEPSPMPRDGLKVIFRRHPLAAALSKRT